MAEIYVDAQITPEDSMICVVINQRDKKIRNKKEIRDINNLETFALMDGLRYALLHAGKNKNTIVFSDSINAVKSYYLDPSYDDIRKEIKDTGKRIIICWVPREINLAGIELARRLEVLNYSTRSNLGLKKTIREKIFIKKERRRKKDSPKA